jgi:hypothetical protein
MCCRSASGNDKLKLAVIEKAKKQLFKGTKANYIPVLITTRKEHSWKSTFLKIGLADILFEKFGSPETKVLPQKAVLLLDNAMSHPGERDRQTSYNGLSIVKFCHPVLQPLYNPWTNK